jgi:hypothetical protein
VKRLVRGYRSEARQTWARLGGESPRTTDSTRRRLRRSKRCCGRATPISERRWRARSLARSRASGCQKKRVCQIQIWLELRRPKRRRASKSFQTRERRPRFGEPIQIDVSPTRLIRVPSPALHSHRVHRRRDRAVDASAIRAGGFTELGRVVERLRIELIQAGRSDICRSERGRVPRSTRDFCHSGRCCGPTPSRTAEGRKIWVISSMTFGAKRLFCFLAFSPRAVPTIRGSCRPRGSRWPSKSRCAPCRRLIG